MVSFKQRRTKSSAQGTIEYLVIIAVVIVIALVVVGLLTGMFQNSFSVINPSVDQIKQSLSSEGVSIYEFVQDPQGDGLVNVTNNSNDSLLLKKITVGGRESVFNNIVAPLDKKLFYLSDLNLSCPCAPGETKKVCAVSMEYSTPDELSKTISGQITATCVTDTAPANPNGVVGLGTGTLANPWIINSCLELQKVNEHLDGNYAIGGNINCYESSSWNGGAGFTPIGTYANSFSGSFDGKGYSVSGIKIILPATNYVGLFGRTLSNASISNVSLTDANISATDYSGILVGSNNGTVTNVSTMGVISSQRYTGGILGSNAGYLTNSHSSAQVTGSSSTGGVVGYNAKQDPVTILGHVRRTYSTGNVYGLDSAMAVGGLVGNNFGEVTDSYSQSPVSSINAFGVGGLLGNFNTPGTLTNSYSTGLVSCTGGSCNSIGGLAGFNSGGVNSSTYWDVTTSTKGTSAVGTGKTTAEMKQQATYSGWDFTNIWVISEGTSYPTLK